MSGKVYDLNERGEPTKKAGWFSWRHRTRDENEAATALYLSQHGPSARRRKASERERRNIVGDCAACRLRHSVDRDCYVGATS